MNQQDQQAIEELFEYLHRTAAQAGPRDPEAESLIQQRFQQGPPGLLYHMAQTLVGQQHALRQARAQLDAYQRQSGAPAGFAAPGPQGGGQLGYPGSPGYPGYGPPPAYQQAAGQYQQTYRSPSGQRGFLAGAGQIALGVGGGILAAGALNDIFTGGGLFGGDRDDDRDGHRDDRDYGGQQDYAGQQDYSAQQDYVGQQDYAVQDDYVTQDPGDGGFDDGGFGDDSGW
jgi:uncharacterized protein